MKAIVGSIENILIFLFAWLSIVLILDCSYVSGIGYNSD